MAAADIEMLDGNGLGGLDAVKLDDCVPLYIGICIDIPVSGTGGVVCSGLLSDGVFPPLEFGGNDNFLDDDVLDVDIYVFRVAAEVECEADVVACNAVDDIGNGNRGLSLESLGGLPDIAAFVVGGLAGVVGRHLEEHTRKSLVRSDGEAEVVLLTSCESDRILRLGSKEVAVCPVSGGSTIEMHLVSRLVLDDSGNVSDTLDFVAGDITTNFLSIGIEDCLPEVGRSKVSLARGVIESIDAGDLGSDIAEREEFAALDIDCCFGLGYACNSAVFLEGDGKALGEVSSERKADIGGLAGSDGAVD